MIYEIDYTRSISDQIPPYDHYHIICERTYRLPIDFLKKVCYDSPNILNILNSDISSEYNNNKE